MINAPRDLYTYMDRSKLHQQFHTNFENWTSTNCEVDKNPTTQASSYVDGKLSPTYKQTFMYTNIIENL